MRWQLAERVYIASDPSKRLFILYCTEVVSRDAPMLTQHAQSNQMPNF